jgi:hypothetical protein
MSHIRPQNQRKTPPERGKDGMGAPGIEAENPVATTVHPDPLGSTGTTGLQGFPTTTTYCAPLRPPTYEPGFCHTYKCPAGQL